MQTSFSAARNRHAIGFAMAGLVLGAGAVLWRSWRGSPPPREQLLPERAPSSWSERAPSPAHAADSRSDATRDRDTESLSTTSPRRRREDSAESDPALSARPHGHTQRMASDDYDALSPESLGAAFLARAIDASSDVDDGALDGIEQDLPGLRISTGPDALATDSEEDQAANEILYGSGAPRDGSGTPRGRARG